MLASSAMMMRLFTCMSVRPQKLSRISIDRIFYELSKLHDELSGILILVGNINNCVVEDVVSIKMTLDR